MKKLAFALMVAAFSVITRLRAFGRRLRFLSVERLLPEIVVPR